MSGAPVTIVESGGIPVTVVDSGAPLVTPRGSGGIAVTLVSAGGTPFVLEGYGYGAFALAADFKSGVYHAPAGYEPSVMDLAGSSYTRSGAKTERNAADTADLPFAADVPGIVPEVGYWSREAGYQGAGADDLRFIPPVTTDEDFIAYITVKRTVTNVAAIRPLGISDGGTNERISFLVDTDGSLNVFTAVGGVGISNIIAGPFFAAVGRVTFGVRRSGGNWSAFGRNASGAVSISTPAAGGFPSGLNRVDVGNYLGLDPTNSPVEFVGFKRGTFSDAELTAMLADA